MTNAVVIAVILLCEEVYSAFLHTAASKDVTNWWLAYWVSTFRYPGDSHMNVSAYNISPIFTVTQAPHYSILEHDAFPAFNVTESYGNVYFYIGIYLGLAAANSVSPQLTVCPVPALCHCLPLVLRGYCVFMLLGCWSHLLTKLTLPPFVLHCIRYSLSFEPSFLPMEAFVPRPCCIRSCLPAC